MKDDMYECVNNNNNYYNYAIPHEGFQNTFNTAL